MKKLILVLVLLAHTVWAQGVPPKIDSLRTRTTQASGVKQGIVEAYINGKWRELHRTMPMQSIDGLLDTIGRLPAGAIDSTIWAKKYLLDGKQAAGTYLTPSDTGLLVLGKTRADQLLATKQASGAYLAASDTGALVLGRARALQLYSQIGHTQAISTVTALQDSITSLLRRAEATTLLSGKATAYSQIDTSAFATSATRKAIYLAGCAQSWQFGIATRKNGLPVAGDQLGYWTKTDSLIVFRAVGTTSGQMFGYWRVK